MTSLISPAAVDRTFDRITQSLPQYVPALPSIILGITTAVIIFTTGTLMALWDRHATMKSSNIFIRTRWIITIAIFLFLSGMMGDLIQNKHYLVQCISINRQHFANVHWLRLYSKAFTGKFAS
jgi:hypothetical protein